jgi:hypothetical protein
VAAIQEFQCELCGIVTSKPVHWFVIPLLSGYKANRFNWLE